MNFKIAGLAVSSALFGAIPSNAATVYVTYTGTINAGLDSAGVFGAANSNLTGSAFKVDFIFDTALGNTFSSPTFNQAVGGSNYSVPTPALSATVTINGIGASIPGSFAAEIRGQTFGPDYSEQLHFAQFDAGNLVTFDIINISAALPASITTPFTYNIPVSDIAAAWFTLASEGNTTAYAFLTPVLLTESLAPIGPSAPRRLHSPPLSHSSQPDSVR